jgi:transcriptional regulator with XRE-family HTH domain
MSDVRIGTRFRAVRRRLGLRQVDVARRARVSPSLVSRIERGQLGALTLDRARRVADVLEIRLELVATWRGGELERLVNARHAALHDVAHALFEALTGWETTAEVSFAVFGERGVIDILAWHAPTRTLVIVELKTELVDPQELVGTMDRRRRLAHRIVEERGWRPERVATWVILADTRTNRRHVARHRRLLRGAFPADGHGMRAWLRNPSRPIDALSFLPYPKEALVSQDARGPRRVRRRRIGPHLARAPVSPVGQRPLGRRPALATGADAG